MSLLRCPNTGEVVGKATLVWGTAIYAWVRVVFSLSHRQLTMKTTLALLFLMGVASAASTYTTKYDNIDLDEILNNQRLYKKYFECLTNKGRCTPDGKELKGMC